MPRPKGSKTVYFSKVKEAREALAKKAVELHETYLMMIKGSYEQGDREAAMENIRWLISHMPKDEEGNSMVDLDIDKPREIKGSTQPSIQIGIALGGVPPQKSLPPAEEDVIDVEVDPLESLGIKKDEQ